MSRNPTIWRALARASQAAIQTYRDEYLSPTEQQAQLLTSQEMAWDDYGSRKFRYNHYNFYYSNKIYSDIVTYALQQRIKRGLYKFTRSIYNPVFRLVELHTSKCYPDSVDIDQMTTGAIPLKGISEAHRTAIRNLWKWTNIASFKTRYPRNLGRFGDCFIQVVDDVFKSKVRLELLHPALITEADITPQGYIDRIVIGYWRNDDDPLAPPWYYEMIVDKNSFSTWRDYEPYAEYMDASGNYISSWPNEYGFVPFSLVRAIELEHDFGGAIFFPTLDKIDQANDLASILFDQIRKTVHPMYWLENVSSISSITSTVVGETDRDRVPMLMGPAGSRATAMVANLDLAGAQKALELLLGEIEADHPELSLYQQRQGERITSPGVTAAYDDGIQRIKDYRGVADSGLVRSHQMAISIGGFRGYDGFGAFNLDSYDAGDLDFQIADRPVLADDLTKRDRVDVMNQSGAPHSWVWEELGKTAEEIEQAEREEEQRRQTVALASSVGDNNE